MRYRKIDPRIHADEAFQELDPLDKLLWFTLLTHPLMTPMGAGVIPPGALDHVIGNDWPFCFRCQEDCGKLEHRAEGSLERFRERSLVLRDKHLVIVRNFLAYNRPDNPNQLAQWISACEELPRSTCFTELRGHLFGLMGGHPAWLFAALLDPLANQENRSLASRFWERAHAQGPAVGDVAAKVPGNVPRKVRGKVPRNHPPNTGAGAGAGKDTHTAGADAPQRDHGFDQFWAAYPRKVGKDAARKAWSRKLPDLSLVLASIDRQRRSPEWQKEDGRFIPHPTTWLSHGRWQDELTRTTLDDQDAEE